MGEVLGPVTARWERRGYGVEVPGRSGLRLGGHPCARTAPLHRRECGERFTHVTWSDGMTLMAQPKDNLQVLALELWAALNQ